MSYWSPDGKKVLRSRSRNSEQEMSVPRRETRAMSRRNHSPEPPVARNPDPQEDIPVARNPDPQEEVPVARNPELEGDVPVSRNPDEVVEVLDHPAAPAVEDEVVGQVLPLPLQENTVQVPENAANTDKRDLEDVPKKVPDSYKPGISARLLAFAMDGTQLPQAQTSQSAMDMDCEPSSSQHEINVKTELESTLRGTEDFDPVSIVTRSGTPVPIEFVPFGQPRSQMEDDMSREIDDIPHLARRRSPRKFPPREYTLGEPYPIPQLKQLRYWKPGAAEQVQASDTGGRKRKFGRSYSTPKKPKMAPTSATSVLNEKYPGLQYIFDDQSGPSHAPVFTVTVNIPTLGSDFSATGTSKKSAKNNLAEMILGQLGYETPQVMEEDPHVPEVLPQPQVVRQGPPLRRPRTPVSIPRVIFPNQMVDPPPVLDPYKDVDFSSDDILDMCVPSVARQQPQPIVPVPIDQPNPNIIRRLRKISNLEENAVNALNCLLIPFKATFNFISEDGPAHDKSFTTELKFMDHNEVEHTYIGKGGSKKKSKISAAVQALIDMIGPEVYATLDQRSKTIGENGNNARRGRAIEMDMEFEQENRTVIDPLDPFSDQYNLVFTNHVRNMITTKYEELMAEEKEYSSQKVLAGVVMTWGVPFTEFSSVVAVTTGTKCIEGDFMSTGGLALNDCHAEVLATRCLRDYFFSQIEELRSGDLTDENCIFEAPGEDVDGQKFRLKEGILFHLYISTSPCGDARIFSPKGLECEEDELEAPGEEIIDTHPNRANRGVLRSKIEAGEGTIPVANLEQGPQTWDGVLQGNALRTMSCSDKVCRWNVVGFQGALLSTLMDPIYYSSIILGSLHHPVHFERAAYGRIEKLADQLQLPYKLNRPKLLMVSDAGKRQVKKSPNHAVLWSINWSSPEIVAASKGKCLRADVPSRVAKRIQFDRFQRIYKRPEPDGRKGDFYYADAKLLASEYQKTLNQMKECFKKSGLGSWISKPMEQDSFCIK